jgi:radical SAM protein with 4Fe4S-binding SPASM domain
LKTLRNPEAVYGLNFTQDQIDDARINNKILTLDLETSHICNYRCIYCYNDSGKKLSNELTTAELKDVVLQGKACGAKNVSIIGGGEPFLHKDIMEIVRYIHSLGMEQDIFTNGTVMTRELADELLSMNVQLVVKLNSLKPDVQDFLAGMKGAGDYIKKALDILQEAGFADKNLLGVESIICKQNYDEIPEMWQWARDRNIIPYFEMITFQGRAKGHDLNVKIEDLQALFERLLKIDEEKYGYTWNPHPPIAGLSCKRHLYNVVIASNGYVYPCVGVNIKLGNIRHDKLGDIIKQSPILKSLRQIDEHIHGSCKSCNMNMECYGCRGMAYHLTGDCFASDPLCWHNEKQISIQDDGTIKAPKNI